MATFTNQATLSYNNITTNSNVITGELLEVLSATKTALRSSYGDGDTVTYVISLVNSGTVPFNGLTVTDDLGGYTFNGQTLYPLDYSADSLRYYVNGVLQTTPTAAGTPLAISGISVPAGGNATLVYETRVNQFAPQGAGGTVSNSAAVTGGGLSAPLAATASVTSESEPRLSISKSLSPATVSENGRLTYTFIILNNGSEAADAGAGAVVADTFDPILSDLAVSFNGAAWTPNTNYTYDQGTGLFSTVAGQIVVPAATYTQDPVSGQWITQPGVATLTVTGTV